MTAPRSGQYGKLIGHALFPTSGHSEERTGCNICPMCTQRAGPCGMAGSIQEEPKIAAGNRRVGQEGRNGQSRGAVGQTGCKWQQETTKR